MAALTPQQYLRHGIIARGGNDTTRIDFRDKLILALPHQHTMLHGTGGKNYAASSSIGLYMSGKNDMKKEKERVSVSCNLQPAEIRGMYQVASRAFSEWNDQNSLANPSVAKLELEKQAEKLSNAFSAMGYAYDKLLSVYEHLQSLGMDPAVLQAVEEAGNAMGNAGNDVVSVGNSITETSFALCDSTWSFEVKKPNQYRKTLKNGELWVPFTDCKITYSPIYQGKPHSYPWYISITNGWAPAIMDSKGEHVKSYNGSKADKDTLKKAHANLSRQDMFAMLDATVRYISVWEQVNCCNNVAAGLWEKQQLLAGYAADNADNSEPNMNYTDYQDAYGGY